MALTPKQQRFVDEYLIDLNATAAARRAGYSARNADKIGPELLGKTGVEQAVREALRARAERTAVRADRVVLELARLAFGDPRRLFRPDGTMRPPAEWDDDTAAAVASVEADDSSARRARMWNKVEALKLLGQHLGLFRDEAAPPASVSVTVVGGIDLAAVVGRRQGLHVGGDRAGHPN